MKVSTCSRVMPATLVGIPRSTRNRPKVLTASRYEATVLGLLLAASRLSRNERASSG
jgi:hypothetical protein